MSYVCYQGNNSDCGFAALKILLANKSHNKAYLNLKKPNGKKKGYSFYELMYIAKQYGFILSAYEMPREDVKELAKMSLALINDNHVVYIKRVGKRKIYYFDPARGNCACSFAEFSKLWTGKVLECVNFKERKQLEIKKERFLPIWMDIVHYLIIGVVFTSLLTGFYLIYDDSNVIITTLFLLLFAFAELVENWYIIKELKLFDSKYLNTFFSRKNNQNSDKYKFYCEYKSKYFIVSKLLLSSLVLITAFSVLLCINDYRNVFVFLILLLVKLLDNQLFSRRDKADVEEISQIEDSAFSNSVSMVASLSRANNLASKMGLRKSLRKVAYLFICLCFAIAMMITNELVSTNFVIFHFGIYYFMSEAFDHIIDYLSSSKDRKLKRAAFLDDCDL